MEHTDTDFCRLSETLTFFNNKLCWGVTGPSAGSWFSLSVGGKIPRDSFHPNTHLSDDCRHYVGEYCLLIQTTAWAIYHQGHLVAHEESYNGPEGEMRNAFARLENIRILDAKFLEVPTSLKISLDGGYVLRTHSLDPAADDTRSYVILHKIESICSVRESGRVIWT